MHSWVEKKKIFLLLSDSSAFARFCVPIRSPFRSKANCLEMHLKWPHLPLLSKDSKTTTFSSFSSLLEKRKRRKFHWKSLQNRIPQCAKMCTKASRETPSPAVVKSYHSIYKINKNLSLSNLGQMRLFQGFSNSVFFAKKVQKTFFILFLDINDPVFQSNV